MSGRLIDLKSVETEFGLRRDQVARMIRLGTIPPGVAVRLGRRVLIDRQAFERFLREGGRALGGRDGGGW